MKTNRLIAFILIVVFSGSAHAGPVEEGKSIFTSRCAGCHNVKQVLTGPALAGVEQRHSLEWIVQFVQSSQTMIKAGDKTAVALYQQFNRVNMPDHTDLSTAHIKSILEYVQSVASSAADKAPFAKPSNIRPAYLPLSFSKDYLLIITYLFAVIILIGTLLYAVSFNGMRDRGRC